MQLIFWAIWCICCLGEVLAAGESACCDSQEPEIVGNSELNIYDRHDSSKRGIVVDVNSPAQADGHITSVTFIAGGDGSHNSRWGSRNNLFFGVFRQENEGDECNFRITRWKKLGRSFIYGNTYQIDMDRCVPVEEGDFIGFFWSRYGVVSYTDDVAGSTVQYCHGSGSGASKPGLGEMVQLGIDSYSYRIYAFQASMCACDCDSSQCDVEYDLCELQKMVIQQYEEISSLKQFLNELAATHHSDSEAPYESENDDELPIYDELPTETEPSETKCTEFPCLVFEDNFDFLDFTKWQHEITAAGGGNWEFQYYTNNRSNSYTRDGNLYIKPTLTSDRFSEAFLTSGTLDLWGLGPPNECTGGLDYGCYRKGTPVNIINPIQSASLRTATSFSFCYGRVETRARMPKGDWLWPAIWLLPRLEEYGMWPASGEIDLVESRGNLDLKMPDGTQMGNTAGGSTLNWGPFFGANRFNMTHADFHGDLADNFHEYAVEWNNNSIVFEFDGTEVLRVEPPEGGFWEKGDFEAALPGIDNPWQNGGKMTPFDQKYYLIMNVAVGGTGPDGHGFFPDSWINGGYPKPWTDDSETALRDFWNAKSNWYPTWNPDQNNGEDAAMVVDYIRVYKMGGDA